MRPLQWLLPESSGSLRRALCRDRLAKRVCAISYRSFGAKQAIKRYQIIGLGKPTFVSHQQTFLEGIRLIVG